MLVSIAARREPQGPPTGRPTAEGAQLPFHLMWLIDPHPGSLGVTPELYSQS